MDQPSKEKITSLLNKTGAPFQDWCAEIVANKEGYTFTTEHPYTWPPVDGLLTGVPSIGTPGSIDLIAVYFGKGSSFSLEHMFVYLIVECKKADSSIKNWIFPYIIEDDRDSSLFMSRLFPKNSSQKERKDILEPDIVFPKLGYPNKLSFDAVTQGFELNEQLSALNRNQQEIIYKHLKQANTGLRAFTFRTRDVAGLDLPKHMRALYLPVLVTTANLYAAKYDPKDVQIPSGELDHSKIDFELKPWITFQFPLPDYLPYFDGQIEKMPTFIVNAVHWDNFLEKVSVIDGFEK